MSFFLPPGKPGPGGEWLCDACPACGKPNAFYFNLDNEMGHCQKGACVLNAHGVFGFEQLESICSGLIEITERTFPDHRKDNKGLATMSMFCGHAWDDRVGRAYLQNRGIGEVVSRTIPIWWNSEKSALVVAVDSVTPEYGKNIVYRMINMPDNKWISLRDSGIAHYVWGARYWQAKPRKFMILTEGIFDIISSGMIGHAVAMLGSHISGSVGCWLRMQQDAGTKLYLWSDPDDAGEAAHDKIQAMLLHNGAECEIITSDIDPKDCSREDIKELLEDLEHR